MMRFGGSLNTGKPGNNAGVGGPNGMGGKFARSVLKKPATRNSIFNAAGSSNNATRKATTDNGKFKTTSPQPTKIATEFSGMGGGFLACNSVVDCHHLVACETDPVFCRVLGGQVHTLFENGCETRSEAQLQVYDEADVLITTAPCRDFSQAGKKKGTRSKRGKLIYEVCHHLRRKKLKAIIMENTWSIANKNHKAVLFKIMRVAKEAKWFARFLKLDSRDFGVCQSRKRCYGVFVNLDHKKRDFVPPMLWKRRMTLKKLLSFNTGCQNIPCKLSTHPREKDIQMTKFKKLFTNKKTKIDPRVTPVAIDIDASKRFASSGVDVVPCLLHSRCKGPYISTRGDRLNHEEIAMVQGYHYKTELAQHREEVSPGQTISMLGDAVTKSVMASCFLEVLYAIGLLDSRPHAEQIRGCVFRAFPQGYIETWHQCQEGLAKTKKKSIR